MSARYHCGTEGRRDAVRDNVGFNGIDYLEVATTDQLQLAVHFVKTDFLGTLTAANFTIEGGVRVTGVKVTGIVLADDVVTVTVDRRGDYSRYRLRLRKSETNPIPPDKFDGQLASIDFSFKVECPNHFDCMEACDCPPPSDERIDIDYLAKDYESFRRVMLDRMALTLPEWRERNPADAGVALVEMLAYVGDALSYEQDAVATEAYLGTARRRTSVRRHARLVDYTMHDGANARAWVHVQVDADLIGTALNAKLPKGKQLVTRMDRAADVLSPAEFRPDLVEAAGALIFETMEPVISLFELHNEIRFYTWSSSACCLPKGATTATLEKKLPNLKKGDVLVLREKRGPESGSELDADPARAHAVRLTLVSTGTDPVTGLDITEVEWHDQDRLPFALCVSATLGGGTIFDIGVAHGNIVLADHGRTVLLPNKDYAEELGPVPEPNPELARVAAGSAACGSSNGKERTLAPLRYRPRLSFGPVTQVGRRRAKGFDEPQPFDPNASAASALVAKPSEVLPALELEDNDGRNWQPQRELLGSDELAREMVVEVEDDGSAAIRFGDDRQGRRPDEGTIFKARYRIGNGKSGNVGAGAIRHIVHSGGSIVSVVNYTPGVGGIDPESMADVRLKAPVAFRRQERAVTPADYEEVATRHPDVQRAAATFRWTGSWYTVYLTVDRAGGRPVDGTFRDEMQRHVDRYRMAGYDLEIDAPRFVPLDLVVQVCALPGYFRSDVERALLEAFSNRAAADGKRGFFHPDNFTLGDPVYVSRLYAAAHAVAGVQSVDVVRFRRRGEAGDPALASGVLPVDRLEIVRLDNDPNFPENGQLQFTMGGGR
jgi:hypothetical protein